MSTGGSKTTTVTNNAPWKGAQPYLKQNLQTTQGLPQLEAFDKSLAVPFSAQSEAGLTGMENFAGQAGGSLGNVFSNVAGEAQGQVSPALQTVLDRARENAATEANLAFSGAGRYGSGSHAEALGRGVSDTTANLLLNQMNTARGQLPTAYQGALSPSQTLLDVGGLREAETANQLSDEARRFREAQDLPFTDVARRNAIYTGAGSLGGSGSSTATTPGTPLWQSALGYGTYGLGAGK